MKSPRIHPTVSLTKCYCMWLFTEQEATSLGTEEYNEVVLSVANIVDPDKNSSSNKKRGNYNHYSPEMRAKIGKYARENGNLRAINHFKAKATEPYGEYRENLQTSISEEIEGNEEIRRNTRKRNFYSTRHSWSPADPS